MTKTRQQWSFRDAYRQLKSIWRRQNREPPVLVLVPNQPSHIPGKTISSTESRRARREAERAIDKGKTKSQQPLRGQGSLLSIGRANPARRATPRLPPTPPPSRPSTAPLLFSTRSLPPIATNQRGSSYSVNRITSPPGTRLTKFPPTSLYNSAHRLGDATKRTPGRTLKRSSSRTSAGGMSRPSSRASKTSKASRASRGSQVSNESVEGVAESLEAIAGLVAGAKKKLNNTQTWYLSETFFHDSLIRALDHVERRVKYYQDVQRALKGAVEYDFTEQHSLVRLYDDMKLTLKAIGKMKSEEGKGLVLDELQRKNYSKQLDTILGSGAAIGRQGVPTAVDARRNLGVWY